MRIASLCEHMEKLEHADNLQELKLASHQQQLATVQAYVAQAAHDIDLQPSYCCLAADPIGPVQDLVKQHEASSSTACVASLMVANRLGLAYSSVVDHLQARVSEDDNVSSKAAFLLIPKGACCDACVEQLQNLSGGSSQTLPGDSRQLCIRNVYCTAEPAACLSTAVGGSNHPAYLLLHFASKTLNQSRQVSIHEDLHPQSILSFTMTDGIAAAYRYLSD